MPASRILRRSIPTIPLLLALLAGILPADDDAKATGGIRKLSSKHLTLYTDVEGPEVDRLPDLFDQAFPQWCQYFGVRGSKHADWHITGHLMANRDKFVAAGLMPKNLPPFEHGYSTGRQLWLYDQPSEFYRRELFLHEGTHCFMFTLLGSCGPPWYMEGIAEFLGTHRLEDDRLTLGYMPKNRAEAPYWGRVLIIQNAVADRRALKLKRVLDFSSTAHRETGPYAWCWAAVTLLDRHPRYQDRFRRLVQWVDQRDFNDRFRRLFDRDWQPLCEEWQLFVANMEYGYDIERSAVDFTPAKNSSRPLAGEGPGARSVRIAADRGWQNSGVRLEAGKSYQLTASGRYKTLGWPCEPGGISIHYYNGRPVGQLLAAVRPDNPPRNSTTALLKPTVVGLAAPLSPDQTGTLFLKTNSSPARLSENSGELKVEIFAK